MTERQTAGRRRPGYPAPPADAEPTQGEAAVDLHAPARVLGRNNDAEFWRSHLTESVRRVWGDVRATALAQMIDRMAENTSLVMSEAVAFSDDPFEPVNTPLSRVPAGDREGVASGRGGRR